jgi:hypothetical protein
MSRPFSRAWVRTWFGTPIFPMSCERHLYATYREHTQKVQISSAMCGISRVRFWPLRGPAKKLSDDSKLYRAKWGFNFRVADHSIQSLFFFLPSIRTVSESALLNLFLLTIDLSASILLFRDRCALRRSCRSTLWRGVQRCNSANAASHRG